MKSRVPPFHNRRIYSVAFNPDGSAVAAAGSDGIVRLFNATNGAVIREFVSVPIAKRVVVQPQATVWASDEQARGIRSLRLKTLAGRGKDCRPGDSTSPPQISRAQTITRSFWSRPGLNPAKRLDVTRMAKFSMKQPLADVSRRGVLTPLKNGSGQTGRHRCR